MGLNKGERGELSTNNKVKVCIIDSGVDYYHNRLDNSSICSSISVDKDASGKIFHRNSYIDNVGHGTAIYSIIKRYVTDIEVYSINIFNDELVCDIDKLLYSLEYVYNNIECKVINLSLGFTNIEKIDSISDILYKLYKKGVIIISAFDNDGAISYPAALPFVIGVDNDPNCYRYNEFVYYDNEVINLGAFGNLQRVAWKNSSYMMVTGASYAAAYITSTVVDMIKGGLKTMEEVINEFKNISKYIVDRRNEIKNNENFNKDILKISKAVVFPYNKEVHSILNFKNLLTFQLEDIYDYRKMGKLGSKIVSKYNNDIIYTIKNVEDLDWDSDFDTLILSHTSEIIKISNEDIVEKIIRLCVIHNKQIYSFDDLSYYEDLYKDKILVQWPRVDKDNVPIYNMNKLYNIKTPVLGVFGTSSKQGKFTLQLILREFFINEGYKVGQIGTEPSSLLFGMDEVFPMGYNSTVNIEGNDIIIMLNNMMHNIDKMNKDIILVGCQSGTIPYSFNNLSYITTSQLNFLLGSIPDAVILCVNPFDDYNYILRSINVIEGLTNCKVISLVVFPMDFKNNWAKVMDSRIKVSDEDIKKFIYDIQRKAKVPCYVLGNMQDMSKLYEDCINYFSE
ncbi:MAG: DUF1611 domain-containing protein [Clostridium sartagoforme]|nr:DUF1611 domain-containing protein [Clostridium sartagoforme]